MIKNCQNCIHKNVCGLKEKYSQYINEMKFMKEKYPEMGFTTDCPSWMCETIINNEQCDNFKNEELFLKMKEVYEKQIEKLKRDNDKMTDIIDKKKSSQITFENEVGINKCDTCKYKKQAQNDIWNPLVRDGERIKNAKIFKSEDVKDKGTIKEPYEVTYINSEDTKEEVDKKLKEILGLEKGETKGNITLNNDGTVTFNNSSEIKTIPSNENNRGKRAERIGYLNLNNNNFQDNKELLDIIMSILLYQ